MLSDVRAGKGSLGKLANDDALYNKLRDTSYQSGRRFRQAQRKYHHRR